MDNIQTYLFVLPWSLESLGGVNQVVINLARQMAQAKTYKPLILIGDWAAVDPVAEQVWGLDTIRWRVRHQPDGMGLAEQFKYALWETKFRPAFKEFCEARRVAVINLHYPGEAAFTLHHIVERNGQPIPVILSFHGTDVTQIAGQGLVAQDAWRFLVTRTAVVACSIDLKRRIVDTLKTAIDPRVIYNGLDADRFVAIAKHSSFKIHRPFLLSIGKFEYQKGQDVLIEAFANLAKDYSELSLVLVGATDSQLPVLRTQCDQLNIAHRVHFSPDMAHEDVASLLQAASIFVLPSRQEAFPIVLMEAGAFALPVIASAVGGVPELLTDGETAFLVAPDQPAQLAAALRSLLDDPAAAAQMGARLRDHVRTRFTWTAAHDKYVALARSATEACAKHPG